jgi:hypothetical protein
LHILDWIEEVSKYTGTNICKLVLANKCDLNIERKVTRDEIEVKYFNFNLFYFKLYYFIRNLKRKME